MRFYLAPLFCLLLFLTSCYRVSEKLEPHVNCTVRSKYLKNLPEAFPPLLTSEREKAWGQEYLLGRAFAKDLDLYRAITALKRAAYLIPKKESYRLLEIEYQILLCYYLGKRYDETTDLYNQSNLYTVDRSFPAHHDLLMILYESYIKTDNQLKATHILRILQDEYPETAKKLAFSTAVTEGNLSALKNYSSENHPQKIEMKETLSAYDTQKKSIRKAQTLNMVLPGAGYLYVGQKQSALTAFLLNGLFIAASAHFFYQGHIAAGIITAGFETGWYFGGIYGGGEAAKFYNERLYETLVHPKMQNEKQFPIFMLRYGF